MDLEASDQSDFEDEPDRNDQFYSRKGSIIYSMNQQNKGRPVRGSERSPSFVKKVNNVHE